MSVEETAKTLLERLCDDRYAGYGLVFTDSEIVRRIPGRRAIAREKEQRRLSTTLGEIITHLRQGGALASAIEIARSAGFSESITLTAGYEQLAQAVANRFRAGDNVWADTFSAQDLIVLSFWHDPTHRRIQ